MKRSERLIEMTQYFLSHPNEMVSLSFFGKQYGAAKSSISEDLSIVKAVFDRMEVGDVVTYPGTQGGVRFVPDVSKDKERQIAEGLIETVKAENRILPGGYIFLSDLLGNPKTLKAIGTIIAHEYRKEQVEVVMTIATKGVPIAQAVAEVLGVPFVIARREAKITEGPTLSVNYISGSSARMEKMTLAKRSLSHGSRVLIVDDYMKGGGTLNGMAGLVYEFDCKLVGAAVLMEGPFHGERAIADYKSILRASEINVAKRSVDVGLGNVFD